MILQQKYQILPVFKFQVPQNLLRYPPLYQQIKKMCQVNQFREDLHPIIQPQQGRSSLIKQQQVKQHLK